MYFRRVPGCLDLCSEPTLLTGFKMEGGDWKQGMEKTADNCHLRSLSAVANGNIYTVQK